tara:strand:- start:757 stop:1134 length:378 start_codon:yes stop_codon:yes gene_type:complete
MAFKFNERRKARTPWDNPMKFGNTVVKKKDLEGNILGEANMDGSIHVDNSVDLDSPMGKRVVAHEQSHVEDIQSGRASYDDESVTWEGKKYPRSNGKIFYNFKWYKEGDNNLPWEAKAIQAEKRV